MFFASCKDDEPASKSNECEIVSFKVGDVAWTISNTNITHAYLPETTVGELTPTIEVSKGATLSPSASQAQNFFTEQGVTYTVTAEDGITAKTYTARATRTPYATCAILSFSVDDTVWTVDGTNVTHVYPSDMDTTELLTPTITLSPGATVNPSASEAQNFFRGVTYTVTAEDGVTTATYTARATRTLYSAAEIELFSVGEDAWTIDGTNITYTYPAETVTGPLTPTITLSLGATVSPAADVAQNFFTADGVQYTVTAEDGTTKIYTAKAARTLYTESAITSFIVGDVTWAIDEEAKTIIAEYPSSTDITAPLVPTITLSPGATVNPASGEAQTDFFTEQGVTYTVTSEDGATTTPYTAKATVIIDNNLVKYDMRDWVVVTTINSQGEYGECKGDQDIWSGGYSMLTIDNDPVSGWNSAPYWDPDPAFPQPLIIDMKETKSISKVIVTGAYFNNVQLYLTDDPQIADYETHWVNWDDPGNIQNAYDAWANVVKERMPDLSGFPWGSPIAETQAYGSGTFSFDLPETLQGRFLIILFLDNDGTYTMIEVRDIEVYGN
jgi:hypothetical protein